MKPAFVGNFKTAVASLRSSRGRSWLTMLGIIIGISSVVTLVSLGDGVRHQINSQVQELGNSVLTVRSGQLAASKSAQVNFLAFLNASTLSSADATTISKLPGVAEVAPMSFVTNQASNGSTTLNNISVIGTSGELGDMLHSSLAYGDFFSDDSSNPDFAVVGPLIAERLFGTLNALSQSFTIGNTTFRVAGVLAPSSGGLFSVAETDFNSAIFIPTAAALNLTHGNSNVLQILVKPSDPKNADQIVAEINAALTKSHGLQDFSVLRQDQLLSLTGGIVDTLTRFVTAIAAVALLVGGIGIMDIMLVSVSERTREIGIRKAIGATNRQILNQFLIEGVVMSVGGGVIGIIFSLLVDLFLRLYTNLGPVVTIPTVALAAGVSVAIGIIFSTIPALQAARKRPIDALRHE